MDFLKSRGIETITLDMLLAHWTSNRKLPARSVVITFDDGYENNYTSALPALVQRGMTATFFIATGTINSPQDNLGHARMSEAQIRELDTAGMTIGSHTVSHPWLGRIGIEDAKCELAESKSRLESIIHKPVRWLCYPSGSFNRAVAEAAKELGYSGACSVIRDNRVRPDQLYWLPRVMVMRDTTLAKFRYYFSPLYHWVHARKNRKRWSEFA